MGIPKVHAGSHVLQCHVWFIFNWLGPWQLNLRAQVPQSRSVCCWRWRWRHQTPWRWTRPCRAPCDSPAQAARRWWGQSWASQPKATGWDPSRPGWFGFNRFLMKQVENSKKKMENISEKFRKYRSLGNLKVRVSILSSGLTMCSVNGKGFPEVWNCLHRHAFSWAVQALAAWQILFTSGKAKIHWCYTSTRKTSWWSLKDRKPFWRATASRLLCDKPFIKCCTTHSIKRCCHPKVRSNLLLSPFGREKWFPRTSIGHKNIMWNWRTPHVTNLRKLKTYSRIQQFNGTLGSKKEGIDRSQEAGNLVKEEMDEVFSPK